MNRFFIPGNVPSSKNSRQWTGKYFVVSKYVREYEKNTHQVYRAYAPIFRKATANLLKPLTIEFQFVRNSRRRFDYINPAQTVQDAMVKYGWIDDDNAEEIIPVFRPYVYDKTNSGVIINILI